MKEDIARIDYFIMKVLKVPCMRIEVIRDFEIGQRNFLNWMAILKSDCHISNINTRQSLHV